jgi:hypothetical protein
MHPAQKKTKDSPDSDDPPITVVRTCNTERSRTPISWSLSVKDRELNLYAGKIILCLTRKRSGIWCRRLSWSTTSWIVDPDAISNICCKFAVVLRPTTESCTKRDWLREWTEDCNVVFLCLWICGSRGVDSWDIDWILHLCITCNCNLLY